MHSTKICRAWELVALSLGIEPEVVGKPGNERFTRAKGSPEFEQRLDDLAAALSSGELAIQQHYAFGPASWKIYAGDFAAWARKRGWTLPEQFNACEVVTPAGEAASVAEPKTASQQWEDAKGDRKRRAALAEAMVNQCQGNKTAAARHLGTHRQTIDRVLKKGAAHSAAAVAPMYAQLTRKPHKN